MTDLTRLTELGMELKATEEYVKYTIWSGGRPTVDAYHVRAENMKDELLALIDALAAKVEEMEWCLDTALREREVEVDTRTDSEMKADLLSRWTARTQTEEGAS